MLYCFMIVGGQYSGEMRVKETTHLIINEPKGKWVTPVAASSAEWRELL